jgi:uncharacterized protein (DUF1499 family)
MPLPRIGPAAPLALSCAALALLALAPLGTRLGWWQYPFGLYRLIPASGFVAVAAVILAVVVLARERSRLRLRGLVMLSVAVVLGAVLVYVPWHYARVRNSLPRIHDISTDLANPPAFSAVLTVRAAERANSVDDRSAQLAQQQKAAYPDIEPLVTALPVAKAFDAALRAAQAMPGWSIVAADANAGRIEASEPSRWFRFTDDVVIRVAGDGDGSRIDVRSVSRQGRSDYGVNAARIRAYMDALRKRIG